MTTITHPLAVVGRRIEFTYYRDLKRPNPPTHPGIITRLTPSQGAPVSVSLRLDGTRTSLHIPPNYQGLRYLDQVVPVPVLPSGPFKPTLTDVGGFEWEGVPAFEITDDVVIALTPDRAKAVAAMNAYFVLTLGIHDYNITLHTRGLRYGLGRFEWEPEDADLPWTMRLTAGPDDFTVPLHYLPT